jgi:haloalkane dehalogenase
MPASSVEPQKSYVEVLGCRMAFTDSGSGHPMVFLHGNPTSSYLWRNITPHVEDQARCLAPDLIGMGDSDGLRHSGPGRYRFIEHRKYLDGWLDAVAGDGPVTLVLHDWGSALGFDWARRHAERVAGLAYMEALVRPLNWAEWPDASRPLFQALRAKSGEQMILEKNIFVERILPGSIQRTLSDEEMMVYRRPFATPGECRRPTLSWPRELPIDGEPADVHDIVTAYSRWLEDSQLPKLFINAQPGAILVGAQREFCRSWKNQTEITVPGIHFIQEDSPEEIGQALAAWHSAL